MIGFFHMRQNKLFLNNMLDDIEIKKHKKARKSILASARNENKKLNTLLVQNGFTLKILMATSGHKKGKH